MGANQIFRPDVMKTIEETLNDLNSDLRELSLKIHGKYSLDGRPLRSLCSIRSNPV